MAVELVVALEASQDIDEAYAWYELRGVGLGEQFLRSVDASIQAILRTPEMYPVAYEDYRRGLVRRFPYVIFYEYDSEKVTVYSVFHTARDPQKWRQRLP